MPVTATHFRFFSQAEVKAGNELPDDNQALAIAQSELSNEWHDDLGLFPCIHDPIY